MSQGPKDRLNAALQGRYRSMPGASSALVRARWWSAARLSGPAWCAAGLLSLIACSSTHAQGVPVAGSLSVEGTLEPVAGAVVYLLDAERGAVRAVLSDSAGDFRFVAPEAGRYSLRIERIGFETVQLPPFDLPEGGVGSLRPVLRIRPVELDAVSVTADRVCDVDEDAGDLVRIWLEARKALMATVLSNAQGGVEFTIEVSERLFDLAQEVVDEVVDTLSTSASSAFEFLEIDELSGVGWGEVEDDAVAALYGPSPDRAHELHCTCAILPHVSQQGVGRLDRHAPCERGACAAPSCSVGREANVGRPHAV